MASASETLATMRGSVEARVREQVERHLRISPTASIERIVQIQMEHERERLERLIDAADEDPQLAEVLVSLLGWLPELEHQLRRRARR